MRLDALDTPDYGIFHCSPSAAVADAVDVDARPARSGALAHQMNERSFN